MVREDGSGADIQGGGHRDERQARGQEMELPRRLVPFASALVRVIRGELGRAARVPAFDSRTQDDGDDEALLPRRRGRAAHGGRGDSVV